MNDPHVKALIYRVQHSSSVDYSQAGPISLECPGEPFQVRVEDECAHFDMLEHFSNVGEAVKATEEFRQAWELEAALEGGRNAFTLGYSKAEVVDRAPVSSTSSGSATLAGGLHGSIRGAASVTANYPSPPPHYLRCTRDVELVLERHLSCREGGTKLGDTAYFCLTMLEKLAGAGKGNRAEAARVFGIELAVLSKIGHLGSEKGGADARKAKGIQKDWTPEERRFLEEAVKAMIRRLAEHQYDPTVSLNQINMSDLPSLPPQ